MWKFNLKLGYFQGNVWQYMFILIVESKRTCDWPYACMESCCWWCCCCCWCEWGWIVGMSKSSSPKLGVWNVWNKRIMYVRKLNLISLHKFRRKQKFISSILLKYYVCRFAWFFFVSKLANKKILLLVVVHLCMWNKRSKKTTEMKSFGERTFSKKRRGQCGSGIKESTSQRPLVDDK